LFGKQRGSEGPVTADVDPSEKNHECHECFPACGVADLANRLHPLTINPRLQFLMIQGYVIVPERVWCARRLSSRSVTEVSAVRRRSRGTTS
jgi:hypothetical protein